MSPVICMNDLVIPILFFHIRYEHWYHYCEYLHWDITSGLFIKWNFDSLSKQTILLKPMRRKGVPAFGVGLGRNYYKVWTVSPFKPSFSKTFSTRKSIYYNAHYNLFCFKAKLSYAFLIWSTLLPLGSLNT